MKKWFIGIDPGKIGGITFLSSENDLRMLKTPLIGNIMDVHKIREMLLPFQNEAYVKIALEDVHALPGTSSKSNFSFGENKGEWRGLIVGLNLPFMEITPKGWQKIAWQGVPVIKKANKKNDTKAMSLVAAKRLFPDQSFLASERSSVPHDGIVDSTLIAYALRCLMG